MIQCRRDVIAQAVKITVVAHHVGGIEAIGGQLDLDGVGMAVNPRAFMPRWHEISEFLIWPKLASAVNTSSSSLHRAWPACGWTGAERVCAAILVPSGIARPMVRT